MAFDRKQWQASIQARFQRWRPQAGKLAADSLYLTLAAAALWPVAEAFQQGEMMALVAMGQLLGSVGGNLIANVVQTVKDEADTAAELQTRLAQTPEIKDEIDELLQNLNVMQAAQAELRNADKAWFAQKMESELAKLGNLDRFTATLGTGAALVVGDNSKSVAQRGVLVEGNAAGDIRAGDEVRQVETPQYIEHYHAADPAQAVDVAGLRDAYLGRLLHRVNRLSLGGIDPKAASDESQAR